VPGLTKTCISCILFSSSILRIISDLFSKGLNPECTKVSSRSSTRVFLFSFDFNLCGKYFAVGLFKFLVGDKDKVILSE
jgi:hypothetical protein